ncbi:protein odr-4 homolog [Porites lutea]|uniref:protein odr-4 homolog n=1 Tax=Porites lutea TaxID=51062 RepID=UPI003CC62BAE
MGRTIIIEERVGDHISSLYGSYKCQIGLVIGQISPQRDYIIHLARTPEQSDAESTPSTLEEIENNWINEHARQVSRMLTGGLDVIGVFAFGPSDMLTKSQAKLRQLLYSVTKAVYHKPASYFDDLSYSRILLQICSATKKITCRTIDTSDQRANLNPAEVKYQTFAPKWLKLETSLSLCNKNFIIKRKLEKSGLQSQVMGSISSLLRSISNALCTVNGELINGNQLLVPGEKSGKSSRATSTQTFKIDVFTEELNDSPKKEETHVVASLSMSGNMCCRAYVHQKATVKEAIQALKYDAIRSFLSRCEVLCEDIMDSQEEATSEGTPSSTWTCPQRVFAPFGMGTITVCDYVFKDETVKESRERMAELLDVTPKEEDFECKEEFPDVQTVKNLVEEMETNGNEDEAEEDEQIQQGIGKRVIGAIVGVVVAVVAAGITFLWGDQAG